MKNLFIASLMLLGAVTFFPNWKLPRSSISVGRYFLFTPPYFIYEGGEDFSLTYKRPSMDDSSCTLDTSQFSVEVFVLGSISAILYSICKKRGELLI